MRLDSFIKAKKLVDSGAVMEAGKGVNKDWFKVKDYDVFIGYEKREGNNGVLRWGCSCRYMGVQGERNHSVCSHILAVFFFVMK